MSYTRLGTCEVCARERELRVVCSGIGAFSYGACDMCLAHDAEPLYVFEYLVWMSNGDLAEAYGPGILEQYSYENRDYIQLGDWIKGRDLAAICKHLDDSYEQAMRNIPASNPGSDEAGIPF